MGKFVDASKDVFSVREVSRSDMDVLIEALEEKATGKNCWNKKRYLKLLNPFYEAVEARD